METLEPDLSFNKSGPFYQMVSAASISFIAYPFVFNPDNPAGLKDGDYIVTPGIASNDRHFIPYQLHTEAMAGNISREDFLGTVCMMLVNTAYCIFNWCFWETVSYP